MLTGAEFEWLNIEKSPADEQIGRPEGYAWIGVKFIAPEAVTADTIANAKYSLGEGSTDWASFADDYDDQEDNGRFWMGGWMGLKEDNQNFLLMHSMAVNVSGQIASVVAGGLMLSFFL